MGRHTYEMGIIGNCAYMAHIDTKANVRWMCWPKFDSSFIFGNLLDEVKGGHFYVQPHTPGYKSHQYYIPNTNVLCTEFHCEDGKFRVVDFAPRFGQYDRYFKPLMLFRKIELLEGNPQIIVSCRPVGEYGEIVPEGYVGSNHIRYLGMKRQVRLSSSIPLSFIISEKSFILNKTAYLVLSYGIPLEAPLESTAEEFLRKTVDYWQTWINEATICFFHQNEVIRSALALKLHFYEDTGAIIASGTTSLPEHPGSGRNWDYRFCWLRDAYFTLSAFNNLGQFKELKLYSNYIHNIVLDENDHYMPVFSITLDREKLIEKILPLKGYLGNDPVRTGNQASEHIQNDIYGEMMVSLLPLFIDERFADKDKYSAKRLTKYLLEKIDKKIDDPDAGLWEFRNISNKHCYTFLFHWAGAHAALKIGEYYHDKEIASKAKVLIKKAAKNIEACYDPEAKVYRQAEGSRNLDASLFQLVTMNYIDPASDKAYFHIKKIEEKLKSDHCLFYRYKHEDDFGKPKNAFLVCSFWYVEALAAIGRVDEAIEAFERLINHSNHLDLMSEDVDSVDGSQWGNFPQTYSHVGLVNAAFRIASKLDKPHFLY